MIEAEAVAIVARMAATMVHRGPDGDGSWVDIECGIAVAHRRLSVVDLSEFGAQPMLSASGDLVITYNGEIYNHALLRSQLTAEGVIFHGHSDTEVLLAAIERWGLGKALDLVDGMFAFGLWDRRRRTLTLARDRMGEKPLYYTALPGGGVVFASTLDAVCVHPRVNRTVDADALAAYLRFNYVPAPWSIVQGVRKLPPGSTVEFKAGAECPDPVPYWSYWDVLGSTQRFTGSDRDAVEHLKWLLSESLSTRLEADVPVGAFLSGGIDSTAIVAIAQQSADRPIKTFTIGSPHDDFDESSAARAIATHLGTDHHELIVSEDDALAAAEGMGAVYDEPFGDASQIPTLLVAQLARRDVTVSISGDAGDELFAGYTRYLSAPGIRRRATSVPSSLRTAGRRAVGTIPVARWDWLARRLPENRRPQQLGLKVHKAMAVAGAQTDQAAFMALLTHWEEADTMVVAGRSPHTAHTDPLLWGSSMTFADKMMAVDAVTYLPDDILVKVDRAAMAVSLETRVPFLSRAVVEFAASLPLDLKIRNGVSKWILRQVLDSAVPPGLLDRPKSGFGLPIDDWLRGPLHSWSEELLSSSALADHVDLEPIRRRWANHQRGAINAGYDLWGVLMLASWLER